MKAKHSILLCVLLLASMSLFAQTTFEANNINYEITSTMPAEVKVIAKTPKYNEHIIIPSTVINGTTTYSVTAIAQNAFAYCTDLISITISDSLRTIGQSAFQDCNSLDSVIIGNSVSSIGDFAFAGCTSLSSVNIPNSVKTIGKGAFAYCENLTSITIPSSVTTIGQKAFEGCGDITVDKDNLKYSSQDGVLYDKNKTLLIKYPISAKENFIIPSSVTVIGKSAFAYCTALTSVGIPNSVETIGEKAFEGCEGLKSVTIPSSVKTIGLEAFLDCTGLMDIYVENLALINLTASPDVFSGVETATCTLHVPESAITDYQTADQWKDFAHIISTSGIKETETLVVALYPNPATVSFGIQGLKQATMIQVCDLAGNKVVEKIVSSPNEFVNVTTWSKGVYLVKINGGKASKLVVK